MSRSTSWLVGLVAAVVVKNVLIVAWAQTCITPNCVRGSSPPECANRAALSTLQVSMTGARAGAAFIPANPKIEPGDCIRWKATYSTHSSSGDLCSADPSCGSPAPAACQWESSNVSPVSTDWADCFYDPVGFPAESSDPFYCRFHGTPTTGMRGTLRVTTPIQLTVEKFFATNSVRLSWTGGGVTGDASYKVARQSGGDPLFPTASTTTVDPDGGVLGTTFTDIGDLGNGTTRYYIIRNKQTNE